MSTRLTRPLIATLSSVLLTTAAIWTTAATREGTATIMPYPATITDMAGKSDLVVKARVLSVEPTQVEKGSPLDNNFWKVCRAKLEVISTLKGAPEAGKPEFLFRSDLKAENLPTMWLDVGSENYAHFRLQPGHSYILFMKRSAGAKHALIQYVSSYTLRPWEGFFNAADSAAVAAGTTPTKAVWNELTKQLHSKSPQEQKDAAMTLLSLSSGNSGGTTGSADFERYKVLEAIFGKAGAASSAGCRTDDCLKELIAAISSASPYSRNDTQMRYLWTKAVHPVSSWAGWDSKSNLEMKPAIPFLIRIADGQHKPEVAAAAILSLGSCQSDAKTAAVIKERMHAWLASPVPEIEAAAVILSSDYPAEITSSQRAQLLQDRSALVRTAAAYSVGITQIDQAIPQLDKMLADTAPGVQGTAALSLMAFPVDKVKTVLASHLNSPQFGVGFLARLAAADPAGMREKLLAECQKKESTPPSSAAAIYFQNGMGTDPHYICVQTLIKYLDAQSGSDLLKPEYNRFLEGAEKIGAVDASRTGDVYRLLLTHRMKERAAAFKKKAMAAQPSLPAVAFEQADREEQAGSLQYK